MTISREFSVMNQKKTKDDRLNENIMDGPETHSNHNRACQTKKNNTKPREEGNDERKINLHIIV